ANHVTLVTHPATILPYRLVVEKRVEVVLPGETAGQADWRELRFRYTGAGSDSAPTSRWVDASRLPLGADSLRIRAVRDGVPEIVGVVHDELVRVEVNGAPALRRTYRTINSLYGNHHEVSHSTFP